MRDQGSAAATGHNAETALKETLGQIMSLEEELAAIKDKIADLWAGAKDAGINTKAARIVIREIRKPELLEEHIAGEMLLDRYRALCGLIGDGADPESAKLKVIADGLRAKGVMVHVGVPEEGLKRRPASND